MILFITSLYFFCQVLGIPRVAGKYTIDTEGNANVYPWLVSIVDGDLHICSGSIIANNTVLTSAHCTLGQLDNLSVYTNGEGKKHKVITIKRHEGYEEGFDGTVVNDIALMGVLPPFEFGDKVHCIALSQRKNFTQNETIRITGWMAPTSDGNRSGLRIVGDVECMKYANNKNITSEGQFCATLHGRGMCLADSGGPLVSDGIQIGMIPKISGCGKIRDPKLFITIDYHITWIELNIVQVEVDSYFPYLTNFYTSYLGTMFWPLNEWSHLW